MQCFYNKNKYKKSLSVQKRKVGIIRRLVKALQYARPRERFTAEAAHAHPRGSFTVEAAFVVPIFVFAAAMVMNLFPTLMAEVQVTAAMQYSAREMAVLCMDEENAGTAILSAVEGKVLMSRYLSEHGQNVEMISGGAAGISLLGSDFSDDYVTLRASYRIKVPISFWSIKSLPVQQCVRTKKWTGAQSSDSGAEDEDGEYVYITPDGVAYHRSTSCPYLDLSIRSVSVSGVASLRNKSQGKYYPCSCYNGGSTVYITDYGAEYHSDLSCSGLKRTVTRVNLEDVEGRHACPKCGG